MAQMCGCGLELRSILEEWGCLDCGGLCCPTCAYTPEGNTYCSDCAHSFFGVYTRPAVVAQPKRISAWWEAAAVQPVRPRMTAEDLG